ncbi:hypothetical protein [Legionella micdadei]|uniref:Uncharacterized protein n=1 Tax=Legionella micdadei TaxID=451 RepID=A0A098GAI3_LEGMI|nr:hypothetical protein [Legionella micdadei]ARG96307.1 hypothetical protein B6N58_00610 [Legionella micdadei]ARG99062.1 hypothetical protein B6V88_00610 [Legionella micdadei]KTD29131.1 hypothetical protein Lmic_1051 [Legionella micdadei]NSL19418.1 hypothetical protein [Legionella micdadei]CEG59499.1 conserved exported protein of unknown function [Legionella micdadei]
MKKLIFLVFISLLMTTGHASKLSKFLHKMDEENRAREQREWQQDMNFGDFSFRLEKRYVDDRGQECRDYIFRARSNPYRHGFYTVCEER